MFSCLTEKMLVQPSCQPAKASMTREKSFKKGQSYANTIWKRRLWGEYLPLRIQRSKWSKDSVKRSEYRQRRIIEIFTGKDVVEGRARVQMAHEELLTFESEKKLRIC